MIPTQKMLLESLGRRRRLISGDKVRVAADFNSAFHPGEVARIDFDSDFGAWSLIVERLGSRNVIIVDLVKKGRFHGERIGNFTCHDHDDYPTVAEIMEREG